jgi:hypothetical protein
MNLEKTLASAVVVTALSLLPLPANAQGNSGRQRGGGRATASQPAQRSDGGRQATVRQAPRESAPRAQARQAAPRSEARQSAPPPAPRAQAGVYGAPQAAPRAQAGVYGGARQAVPRAQAGAYGTPQAAPRANGNRQFGSQPAPRQAVPRQSYGYGSPAYRPNGGYNGRYYGAPPPRYGGSYSRYYARPYYGHYYARPYGWTAYRPYYFGSAYYAFRPWFSIGFGLSIGYPVSYPWAYLGSYQPRVYGYYDSSYAASVTPGVSVYGGLSFDIQPAEADLFVDNEYVGTVGTFTPYGEPLTLTPGQHHILVQCEGYRAMEWDVTIEPGQVIPYRGVMQR